MQAGSCIKQRGRGQTLESHAYLSPGSARYSLGHLRETTCSFVGIEPVPGGCDVSGPLAFPKLSNVCTHYPVAGVVTVPWSYIARVVGGVRGSLGDD